MLKLYGFPLSNYYNMVKLALLEKGIEFEDVITRPSQKDGFLNKSPMGKIPCLETDDGVISETNVILDYLDDCYPQTPLHPADPFQRAKARELTKSVELYLELVVRQLYGSAFFGAPVDESLNAKVSAQLDKGIIALNRILVFSPYAAGEELSHADLMLYYTLALGNLTTIKALGRDIVKELPGCEKWLLLMEQNDSLQQVNVAQEESLKALNL